MFLLNAKNAKTHLLLDLNMHRIALSNHLRAENTTVICIKFLAPIIAVLKSFLLMCPKQTQLPFTTA